MFCGNCGAQNEDNAAFCIGCGASLKDAAPVETAAPAAPVETAAPAAAPSAAGADKNKKVGIIAVAAAAAVVVIALVVLIVSLAGGKAYEKAAVNYFEAIFDGDAEATFESLPKQVLKRVKEEADFDKDEYKELIEEAEESFEDALEYLEDEYGRKYKVEIEIDDVDDYDEDDLEYLQDMYDELDIKVTDAKKVSVDVRVKGEDDSEHREFTVAVIKVGGSWGISATSLSSPVDYIYSF